MAKHHNSNDSSSTLLGSSLLSSSYTPDNYLHGVLDKGFIDVITTLVEGYKSRIKGLYDRGNLDFKSFVMPIMDMDEEVQRYSTLVFLFNAVNNTEESVRLEDEVRAILIESSKEFYQNENYAKAFTQISRTPDLTPSQRHIINDYIDSFRLNGMTSSVQVRKRVRAIDFEVAKLESQFNQNVLKSVGEYTLTVHNEGDLGSMPASEKNVAKTVDDQGNTTYVFTLQAPSYIAFMSYCTRRDLRESMYRAFTNMGEGNGSIIEKLLALRYENAQLLGYNNYGELSLALKSASGTSAVFSYLYQLAGLAKAPALKELAVLQEYGKSEGIGKLEPWDAAFISKKVQKETLHFDETKVRPFFEKGRILQGVFSLVEGMFGLRFELAEGAKLWHSTAEKYEIFRDNRLVGSIYIDLESRKGKRNGAWVQEWGTFFTDSQGGQHLPSVFLVCNFPPSTGDAPSLLTHSDVTTLFHEMGHAVHHLLSAEPLRGVSGFNGVKWDLVEYPSQWLEAFAYNPEVLHNIAKHHETGETIDADSVNKLNALRNYNSGMGMLRQLEFSIFDMEIHTTKPLSLGEVKGVLAEVRKKTAIIEYPAFNNFQNSFLHIFAGGYSAGYYSYKWAETYAAETYIHTVANKNTLSGVDNSKVSTFETAVLAKLSGSDMGEIYNNFLGHPTPNIDSMLMLLGLKSGNV